MMDHGYVDNGGGVDTGNAKEFLFLQEKVLEVAREGDTKEMRYLMGISAAQRLLGAHDQNSKWSLLHYSCSRGFVDITHKLLEAGANPLKALDKHGKTCLHVAIEYDGQETTEALLRRYEEPAVRPLRGQDCPPRSQDAHYAVKMPERTVKRALRYPVSAWPRLSKLTLGETAARSGRRAAMLLLLEHGLNPNERGTRGETPLHLAARFGHADLSELLLDRGADVDARESWMGRTPLHYACQAGAIKVATVLMVKGRADAHLPDLSAARHTPLEVAVVSGHRAMSHHLVTLADTLCRAEKKRREDGEEVAPTAFEATLHETNVTRHRVHALRRKASTKRLLVRMEKEQLEDTLSGEIARANTRLRSLESQHERLGLRAAADKNSRPRTCPATVGGVRRPRTAPEVSAVRAADRGLPYKLTKMLHPSETSEGDRPFVSKSKSLEYRKRTARYPVRAVWGLAG